jgi:hypothetical protein
VQTFGVSSAQQKKFIRTRACEIFLSYLQHSDANVLCKIQYMPGHYASQIAKHAQRCRGSYGQCDKPFRIRCLRVHTSLTDSVAPEPRDSSSCSKTPATGPYPEQTESTLHPPAKVRKIYSDPILPSTPWSSEWSRSFGISKQNLLYLNTLQINKSMYCAFKTSK